MKFQSDVGNSSTQHFPKTIVTVLVQKIPNLCFGNGIGINACSVIRQDGIEKILRIASFGSVSHRTGKGSVTQFTFQRVLGQPMSLFSVFIPKVPKKITNPDLPDEFCFTLHNLFEYMVARE